MDSKRLVDIALDRAALVGVVGAVLAGSYLVEVRELEARVIQEEIVLLFGHGLAAAVLRPPAGAGASNWFALAMITLTVSRIFSVPMFFRPGNVLVVGKAPIWIVMVAMIVQTICLMIAFGRFVRHRGAQARGDTAK